ncbi:MULTISPECIES: hypothetical protein [unclassified Empedobacter]|uniref:hypothetical protein n=1 Tax=unclassified Empedobacter TaxID=2643773 RepID=UPI000E80FF75|nr:MULTISPECIES: hypothetical protein [unclassified Empedobacter]MDH0659061.1 hypothetical protein [Empedobacter sp. GD03865]HBX62355.1 hypothetical protein [Flavobacteriaceae bacterium]
MNSQSSEIEIGALFKNFLQKFRTFLQKNFLFIILLAALGLIVAYFINPILKNYESKVIVTPNYGSVDYLYNEIELINSKISDKDTVFLNKIGITPNINKIEIKPITNIYQFAGESESNFDLLKLFAEDGDINKVADDEKTSKNYKTHQIILTTKKSSIQTSNIDKLLKFLNKNEYYNQVRLIRIENEKQRLGINDGTIKQIDAVFSKVENSTKSEASKNLVYVNDNNQLNDLLITKRELIKENEYIKLNELLSTNIIKKISESLNVQAETKGNLLKIILPILFIGIFLFIRLIFTKQK